ncbi:acyl-CoA dehydrogenase family protein [Aequorivita ciconiae]|nr:acyl-CoA dehydrogenase family protein [Aequorivita sp. H23M31]
MNLFKNIGDDPQKFPLESKLLLKELDLMKILLPVFSKNESIDVNNPQNLLNILFELGKGNLSIGRIIEGHINALLLINAYGTENQKKKYFEKAQEKALFGVWNTEASSENVRIRKKDENFFLEGAKNFCSGGTNLSMAIVTAERSKKPQMILMDISEETPLEADWSLWNPIGMRASVSCKIDFSGIKISADQFLGNPGDYFKEPHFSWGGVRFSAVQLGGAKTIFDRTLQHLKKQKRNSDPYQKQRLGKMAILMESAEQWIYHAIVFESQLEEASIKNKVNFANMMRYATLDICEEIISLAEKAVGVQASMKNHPLEQPIRDLRVYLKQAGPDAALASVGDFVTREKK